MDEPSKDSTQCPWNSPFTLLCEMQPTYMRIQYVPNKPKQRHRSNDAGVNISCGVRLFEMTAIQIRSYKQRIKHVEYVVYWERNTVWF